MDPKKYQNIGIPREPVILRILCSFYILTNMDTGHLWQTIFLSLVRGCSQTTLPSYWLFWPPTRHFLPYKLWQKVNIFGLPTHLLMSTKIEFTVCYIQKTNNCPHFFAILIFTDISIKIHTFACIKQACRQSDLKLTF